jgi:N-formylglutamate deformylase
MESECPGAAGAALTFFEPAEPPAPLVFDSPHSGTWYPADFRPAVSMQLLRGGEDRFVDRLVADAPARGIAVLAANWARTYVDANRAPDDLDPLLVGEAWPEGARPTGKAAAGLGVIFRLIGNAVPIYDRTLSPAEVQDRIERYWWPYHCRLERLLRDTAKAHGAVWHVNWHSMQSIGSTLSPDEGSRRPDFALGDLYGRACEPGFTAIAKAILEGLGYSVRINDPYAGAEILERYGRPEAGVHSLQIEINRALYMNEQTLEAHDGLARLRQDLGTFVERLAAWTRARRP